MVSKEYEEVFKEINISSAFSFPLQIMSNISNSQ